MNIRQHADSFTKKYLRVLLGLFVVVLFVHDVFGVHGFMAMQRTRQSIKTVQTDLEHLNKENADLMQAVKDLKTDPRSIEKIAREELILARPGEIIIKIPQPQLLQQSLSTKP